MKDWESIQIILIYYTHIFIKIKTFILHDSGITRTIITALNKIIKKYPGG